MKDDSEWFLVNCLFAAVHPVNVEHEYELAFRTS